MFVRPPVVFCYLGKGQKYDKLGSLTQVDNVHQFTTIEQLLNNY